MKITDIQPQKKNQNKVSVFIDGEFAFGMYQRDLETAGLCCGNEITSAQLSEIKDTILLRSAKEAGLSLLSRKDYTRQMMAEKLRLKQFPEDVIQNVLIFLEQYRYLDDTAYAARYVRYHSEMKGVFRLRQELSARGVTSCIIEEALSGLNQLHGLSEMIEKKMKALPEGYGQKELQRVKNYFLRRGFSYEEINKCMKHFTIEEDWSSEL